MSADPLLGRVGTRIRDLRTGRSLTLRDLAAIARVSERFLISVEGGSANVSVLRLESIARALGTSAADLLAEQAMPAVAAPGPAEQGSLVTLLGLRGAGKSTIGRAASERLGIPFVELDAEVERRAGMTSGEIFELHGRAYYYRLERQELERLAAIGHRAIVATAGSIVTDHPSFELLLSTTSTIWLKAKAEDHYRRVLSQGDARPMENRADAMLELRGLLKARRALYERARHVVDTSSLGLSRSIDRVVRITRAEPRERTSIGPSSPS